MTKQLDVLFIQPNSRAIYQNLRGTFSAVETPTWHLLLAQSCRVIGYGVEILDCDALDLEDQKAVELIHQANPRLAVFVVYGSEPNQGTTRMSSAVPLAQLLKATYHESKICFVGSHTQALPLEVLALTCTDFVLLNEGVYALHNLLKTDLGENLWAVKGVGWKPWLNKGSHEPRLNEPEKAVRHEYLDIVLSGYAWDLLPKREKDLDLYRSHFWFGSYKHELRTPYASIYTSLNCPFKCNFCMINLISRVNNLNTITAADSSTFRYWTHIHTMMQIERLVEMGVKNIRFSDEMFLLRPVHFEPILRNIKERWGNSLNIWCYARIDTIKKKYLELLRDAGVAWICIGVESANRTVRKTASKGSFQDVDITDVVREVENHGIKVIANFIVGLEGDTYESMCQTKDLALELRTHMMNVYPCMALPGTGLYAKAKAGGKTLPETYSGYGFLSYDCLPLGTDTLSSADIVKFRDEMFHTYWSDDGFHKKIIGSFGQEASDNIKEMCKIKLKRKLLGD